MASLKKNNRDKINTQLYKWHFKTIFHLLSITMFATILIKHSYHNQNLITSKFQGWTKI